MRLLLMMCPNAPSLITMFPPFLFGPADCWARSAGGSQVVVAADSFFCCRSLQWRRQAYGRCTREPYASFPCPRVRLTQCTIPCHWLSRLGGAPLPTLSVVPGSCPALPQGGTASVDYTRARPPAPLPPFPLHRSRSVVPDMSSLSTSWRSWPPTEHQLSVGGVGVLGPAM
jgi:hypothetical protein